MSANRTGPGANGGLPPEAASRLYDRIGRLQDTQSPFERAALERLVTAGRFGTAKSVFELGCGTGTLAERIIAQPRLVLPTEAPCRLALPVPARVALRPACQLPSAAHRCQGTDRGQAPRPPARENASKGLDIGPLKIKSTRLPIGDKSSAPSYFYQRRDQHYHSTHQGQSAGRTIPKQLRGSAQRWGHK